jgi:hypothetical protein
MMTGNVSPMASMIDQIRKMQSSNRELLPQRSGVPVSDASQRTENGALYLKLKDQFIDELLFRGLDDVPGIYFFVKAGKLKQPFFYIGKSGSGNGQAAFVRERLRKHLLTFDYFIYGLAFPHNVETYYADCLRFYAEGKYSNNLKTYQRQFKAFRELGFSHVAWVGDQQFSIKEVDQLETYFVSKHKPPANGAKLNAKPSAENAQLYPKAETFLLDLLSQHGLR